MDRLSLIIPKVLQKRGLHEHMTAGSLLGKCTEWIERSMGTLSASLHTVTFSDGWLLLEADNPVALFEFSQRQEEMLAYLRSEAPHMGIVGVRVVRTRSTEDAISA